MALKWNVKSVQNETRIKENNLKNRKKQVAFGYLYVYVCACIECA